VYLVRILISYASFSGNTKEVAEIIEQRLAKEGCAVEMHRIGRLNRTIPDPSQFDLFFLGTFTWGKGDTPHIVKDFVLQIGYKPPNVFVFGTGDTQFGGDDLFCKACDKLATFYGSTYAPLKIEQSPRGSQEPNVTKWTEGVLKHWISS
jgi:flavodoxin I